MKLAKGTAATKDFYDRVGWTRQDDGMLVDAKLFGWANEPIRKALDLQRKRRLRQMAGGPGLKLVELACGANPAVFLADKCESYTAVDFSPVGLMEAAAALERANVPFRTVEADITHLPFDDGTFDLAYSAQAIYHIDTADGQVAAFSEAMRVLRPDGRAIFVLANPFPILFPYRSLRRLLAMTPGINTFLNGLRPKPPLPYLPMPLGWMKKQLSKWGDVTITAYAIANVDFDHRVSETTAVGSLIWRAIGRLETNHADLATRLGCYVIIIVDKRRNALPELM
jgi:ubiquinone/menaquinone biosynthesis C-methylase UbiE